MIGDETRLDYSSCLARLFERIGEPAPGRVQLLAGPRQVGKTTLLLELQERLGDAALYAAGDEPAAALPGFWEQKWREAESRAERGKAVLLLDEVQHFPDWVPRLKGEWDRLKRRRVRLHVVATGSSALHVGAGSKESLAGRFEKTTLAHWSASALMSAFRLGAESAAAAVVQFGSYPGAFPLRKNPARWRAYVREAIAEAAIGRDVLALSTVRRPALLRQVFALAVGMPAQIVSLQKLQGQLHDKGALDTVSQYLGLLEEAFLVAGLEKFGAKAVRRRAAPPKLVTLNNALISALHPDGPPDRKVEPARFGAWVENACLAHAWNAGQAVSYWREEPLEVDAVIDGSWGPWAVEVKTGRFDSTDLRGLVEFCRRHPRYRPLVVTDSEGERLANRVGIDATTWTRFLVSGAGSA
ncbi:MAG: ATP-binding protein [Planctomycetes bacterium]|nr:ATP-binding protein [Planctomycetota bacterium]MBI3847820.1 ATP-binding protein [Planctomycetota bacterium]